LTEKIQSTLFLNFLPVKLWGYGFGRDVSVSRRTNVSSQSSVAQNHQSLSLLSISGLCVSSLLWVSAQKVSHISPLNCPTVKCLHSTHISAINTY